MAKKKKAKRRARPIITGYLEKVSAKVFDDFSSIITDMIKGHQGIYSLYKKDKLYYVGLASNLKTRIKYHLRDKHQGKWTHFSLYIIRKENHIKEMESLVLRIAYPKGNSQRGKLAGSKDIRPLLKKKLDAAWKSKCEELMGKKKPAGVRATKKTTRKKKNAKIPKSERRPLAGVFKGGKVIYVTYKGKDYKAWIYGNGRIKFNGQIYNNPSAAGSAVRGGKPTNGWSFWKYKDKNGNLVRLKELRK